MRIHPRRRLLTGLAALASLAGGVRESTMDVEGIDPLAVYAALISMVALGWQSWKEHQARRPRVEVKIRWAVAASASSNNRSVLVFVHLIKLAFTIGIESSFQLLEIPNQ